MERFIGGYDLYVGVIIATIAVFVFAIKNETYTFGRCFEFIGEKLTLYCYLLHPLILQLLQYCEEIFGMQGVIYEWCRPVIVVVTTLMLSEFIYTLKRRIAR